MSEQLADELFRLVEYNQGKAHISDGIGRFTDEEIIEIAVISLQHTERTARLLRSFLKKHAKVRP